MRTTKRLVIFYSLLILFLLLVGGFFFLTIKNSLGIIRSGLDTVSIASSSPATGSAKSVLLTDIGPQKPLPNPPSVIRAIYLTSWSAGTKEKIAYALDLARKGAINAVVIDIKDYSGHLAYDIPDSQVAQYHAAENRIPRINSLLKQLHDAGIYVIGRITVFQDPILAHARPDMAVHDGTKMVSTSSAAFADAASLWHDEGGLNWMDPASRGVWEYVAAIAKDAVGRGFDEVNFDYVRFPSGGSLGTAKYPSWDQKTPRHVVLKNFFEYMRNELRGAKISADLFGFTTFRKDDLGIGQEIEDAFPYFDYLAPMVYPSHYGVGFLGYKNPASYPYEVITYSLKAAEARRETLLNATSTRVSGTSIAKLRPWLQDFELDGVSYDAAMIEKEIQATKDSLPKDYAGFMMWSPTNVYTEAAGIKYKLAQAIAFFQDRI